MYNLISHVFTSLQMSQPTNFVPTSQEVMLVLDWRSIGIRSDVLRMTSIKDTSHLHVCSDAHMNESTRHRRTHSHHQLPCGGIVHTAIYIERYKSKSIAHRPSFKSDQRQRKHPFPSPFMQQYLPHRTAARARNARSHDHHNPRDR